jgi:hypothetical protein
MELTKEQRDYCYKECPIGKAKSKEFLDANNSAYDAALDMMWFVEKCSETCERCKNGKSEA